MLSDTEIPGLSLAEFVCPVHGRALLRGQDSLTCPEGDAFPIRNEIPRFVDGSKYTDTFGVQWNKYRLTQLDSYSGVPLTRDRVRRCLGESLWANLAGKQILECGCGAGRFTEILLERGAHLTSIDLSDAVDANQQNFPQSARHRIAQADILRLPFRPAQFDVVLCLGVIQHTPNPEQTIVALARQVKIDGALVIDHYTYNVSEFSKSAPIFRSILRRLPPHTGLRYTERIVEFFLPLHKRLRHLRYAQMLLSRISPVLCYYAAYPELKDDMQYEWALLDTHDSLTCWYRHFRTKSQIERALKQVEFKEIVCEYGGNGVEARGRRPSCGSSSEPLRDRSKIRT